ncbi:MAG: carbohydrate ABC transporter permease [Cellulomonadaceae bacterium]|nr:carbohydrate ABC transporter permease [Cellulomonadaceae bacterium]
MSATPEIQQPTAAGVPAVVPGAPRRKVKPPKEGSRANWLVRLVLVVVVLGFFIPTFGLLVTSFRTRDDALATGWWTALANPFGSDWILSNYTEVLSQGMGDAFINSLVVTIPATIIPILIAAMAAYAFTFTEFRGRDTLFVVVVGLLVIPNQVALVPLLKLFGSLNLVGQFPSVWLAHAGFGMPLAIFILRSYMSTLPKAVIESAKIDGASHYQTFWRLILPMSVPALASFAIFQFLWVWNDLLVALLFLGGGENEVVTQNLASLLGQYGDRWDLLAPGAFVSMLLPLTVFIALQRYFVRGMTAGSVKG